MRNFRTKAICLLSSAVLLCGATGITASAAPQTGTKSYSVNGTSVATSTNEFYLSSGDFELAYGSSKYVSARASSSFTIPAGAAVSYQWYKDGTAISGATEFKYLISEAGKYGCRVTVKAPRVSISGRKVTTTYPSKDYYTGAINVTQPLKITSQPKGGTVLNAKQPIKLSVGVTGGKAPYTYEWTWDSMGTVGENSPTYDALFAGYYCCKITDKNGNYVTSNWANISVSLLQITAQSPEYVYLSSDNGTADLFVKATGGKAPYKYKWTCNGKDINRNSASITVSETGNYRCTVTDAYGEEVKSNVDGMNVMKPFEIDRYATTSSVDSWSYRNNEYTLKVNVKGGTGRYSYNWQRKNGSSWVDVGCHDSEYTINRDDIKDTNHLNTTVRYGKPSWYEESKWIECTEYYAYNTYRCVVKTIGNHGNGNVVSVITTDDIEAWRYLGYQTNYYDNYYF